MKTCSLSLNLKVPGEEGEQKKLYLTNARGQPGRRARRGYSVCVALASEQGPVP